MITVKTSSVIFVLLCEVYLVRSVKIAGTVTNSDYSASKVEVSEYINGNNWEKTTKYLTLNRLVDGNSIPTLTLTNFPSLKKLNISNIVLEQVPVFENISSGYIYITANKIKHVQTNAFIGAEVGILHLDNNEIQSMSDGSVNEGVTGLSVACNKLREFSIAWFKDPNIVYTLDLSGNQIEQIQNHAFDGMTNLIALLLRNNRIARIGSEAFGASIVALYLHFNDIGELRPDMFADPDDRLNILYLHHNQLSFLSEALLVKLKVQDITLDGNPWQCQCLRDIERWLREQNISRYYMPNRRGEPVCVMPLSFQNKCVPVVIEELQRTYANGLSPVQECLRTPCNSCEEFEL